MAGLKEGSGQLIATLRAYLEKVPFPKILSWKKEARLGQFTPDAVIRVSLPGREQTILVVIRSSGQPRFAREAANQPYRYRDEAPGMYGVFMAPYISSQAAAFCEKAGMGYADLAGNCHLVFGQLYIERRDWPSPSIMKRELRSLFTPKASRILSALLSDPRRSWKVLEEREWVERSTKGFRLSCPEDLLAA
jgi:hypothetical protein